MAKISVIGLGYVGIHVAVSFGKYFSTIGYDINKKRINELKKNIDTNGELSSDYIIKSKKLKFSNSETDIKNSDYYIITVPTPIDENNVPDLKLVEEACKLVSKFLKKKDIVIFESTFYPGCTENDCVPILEKYSKLKYKIDFTCAYSPERINPGDKKRKFKNINKIVGASDKFTLNKVAAIYQKIIIPKIFKTSSIAIAEASKIIENTQRDLNIALMNEFSIIFSKLNIDTKEVIKAASTKWNFNKYYPGMVGGHCIGVDPYYLAFKSKKVGYNPKLILKGREINENVSKFVFQKVKILAKKNRLNLEKAKTLILGVTFKKNCGDIRNSKVFDLIDIFKKKSMFIKFYDPYLRNKINKYKRNHLLNISKSNYFDIIILSVDHDFFLKKGIRQILKYGHKNSIFFDINGSFKGIDSTNKL